MRLSARSADAVSTARPALELLGIAALGALQTLACVHTGWWWMQLACVGVFAWRISHASPRRAALLGLLFGGAWFGAATWWLYVSMHHYGGLPAWMTVLSIAALSLALALYLAAGMALVSFWRSSQPWKDALSFASAWLLAELARGVIFTGFPWAASGYGQVDSPLIRLAPWIGVYGIGFVIAWMMSWAAFGVSTIPSGRGRWIGLAVAAGLVLLLAVLPPARFTQPTGTIAVSLLQGNIPQEEKFATEHQGAALRWHVDTMLAARGDLVIAPETAVPFLPQQLPEDFWPALRQRFTTGRTHALFGVPLGSDEAGYTNSAVGFAPGRAGEYRYDKHHLVPFGEFIPTGFRWFTQMMDIPLGDFARGTLDQPSFAVAGERVAPNICYEDLFGEELAKRFVDTSAAPTMFANISNIGWFGDTIAIPQHLNISRLRSLEFERPMLRATNTGATVVIDFTGRVTHSLVPYSRGVLEASVQGRSGSTPFAWWAGRLGLWPLLLLAVGLMVAMRHRGATRAAN